MLGPQGIMALSHLVSDQLRRNTSFSEIEVKQERRCDDIADWTSQDRIRLTGTCYLSEGEVRPPTESRGGRELVRPLRKVVKVWNSCYGERKWSR